MSVPFSGTDLPESHVTLTTDTGEKFAAASNPQHLGIGTQQNGPTCSQAQTRFTGTISTMRREGRFEFFMPLGALRG